MFGTASERLRIRLHQFDAGEPQGAVLLRRLRSLIDAMHHRYLLHGLVLSIALVSAAAGM